VPGVQADETLAKFLDFCTYGHMIDNVVLIVTGTLHERDVQVRQGGCAVMWGRTAL
jgi:vacuolar-type H+-ATPase subunit C/Vma6